MNIGLIILTIAVFALLVRVAMLDYRLYLVETAFDEIEIKPTKEQLEKIIDILQEDGDED